MMFQSTPPHGGRQAEGAKWLIHKLFQSTPPHGGRHAGIIAHNREDAVSIHAPAWGATLAQSFPNSEICSFNPRPRMGGDDGKGLLWQTGSSFNPRPRMGGDSSRFPIFKRNPCFNPRPRMGGDKKGFPKGALFLCFNPRPRMGGDGL